MHDTIDVRFTISIDEDKTIPLATLAEFITDQNVESILPEGIVARYNLGSGDLSVVVAAGRSQRGRERRVGR